MLPAASGGFRVAEQWHWPGGVGEEASLSLRSAFMLQETQHIVDLDAECRGAPGANAAGEDLATPDRSEEHTSELQSLMRNSYAVFCLTKKTTPITHDRR